LAEFTVTTTADDGSTGSLWGAVAQANANAGADTITFASGKRRTRLMLDFKSFQSAAATLDGIEVTQMIRKGQLGSSGVRISPICRTGRVIHLLKVIAACQLKLHEKAGICASRN